jgi:hypothetical protein
LVADIEGGSTLRVFENRVLRGMFEPKSNEVTGKWRKLHNEELHDLYSSPNLVQVIKCQRDCRGMWRVWGEACTGFWWETLKERDHWRDPGVDGRIILRQIFRKWNVGVWTLLG